MKETNNIDEPMKRSTPQLKKTAEYLILWREELGLTAEDIAKKSGLDMEYIERVETGKGEALEFLAYTKVLMKAMPKEKGMQKWEGLGKVIYEEARKIKPE